MFNEIREDAINALIDCLADGYEGDYDELHNEVFNSDYYVRSDNTAKMILDDEAFDAIGKVQDYETSMFGSVTTDLSCPSDVINMLYYIIGEEIMTDIMYEVPSDDTVEKCVIYDECVTEDKPPKLVKKAI